LFIRIHTRLPRHWAPGTVSDVLLPHISFDAAYNSGQRESEHASTCQEGTRKDVINRISNWVERNPDHPICWLEGPAGSGKSTIAHTIAEQCADKRRLAFSFFFSRGKPGRSDTSKFFPTFAHQLASIVPAIQVLMQRAAVAADSSIPFDRLRDQMKKLIIDPLLTITNPIDSLIVIIDGLDECGGDVPHLIQLLVDFTVVHRLPFRFLFASRPEAHIRQTFRSSWFREKTYHLTLRDFDARDDIRNFLRLHLSTIRDAQDELMQGVSRHWPSQQDLEVLVDQSEGLFIYVSTLVKFVADRNGLPIQKLQAAMRAHKGVDPLYDQVLSEGRMFDQFDRVIGAVMFHCDRGPSFTVRELEQFLRLPSGSVRLALRGCQSILVIPDNDFTESVRPYHASLRDFLVDPDRAKHHFFNPMKHHVFILADCVKLMMAELEDDTNNGNLLTYACQNWCHHFLHVLLNGGDNSYIDSHFNDWISFIMKVQQQWLKLWVYKMDKQILQTVLKDLCSTLERIEVSTLCLESASSCRWACCTGVSSREGGNKQPGDNAECS
jgi:hypothetical protein